MRKLFSFLVTSADGYYAGPQDEFDWPNVDEEFNDFSVSQLNDVGTLLFGRITYEFMAGYWPSEAARTWDPIIAEMMNSVQKVVFSNTLTTADWENSTLVKDNVAAEVSRLKEMPGKDLAIFGSPTFTRSLLELGLLDELRIMVHPVLLGDGKSLFSGTKDRVQLELLRSMTFGSGNVLLYYRPKR